MQAPFKLTLLGALFASGALLQGCSDNGDSNTQESAMAKATTEPMQEKTEQAEKPASAGITRTSAPADASVSILSPKDGATVTSPVSIEFGIEGMAVAPAGSDEPNSGHHHLLIDEKTLPALDAPIPSTDTVIHFGGGQTETTQELAPGEHTLQLLLGDSRHVPHKPVVKSDTITITVE